MRIVVTVKLEEDGLDLTRQTDLDVTVECERESIKPLADAAVEASA